MSAGSIASSRNRVRDAFRSHHGLDRDRIVLACSHTHSGPVIGTNLLTMYKIDAVQRQLIAEYAEFLVGGHRQSVGPGHRSTGRNRSSPGARAAVISPSTAALTRKPRFPRCDGGWLAGAGRPRRVGVESHRRRMARLLAVVFGYACHCTVLDSYKFCGDYAGFAQVDLENEPSRCPGDVRRRLWRRPEPDPSPHSSWPPVTANSSPKAWKTALRGPLKAIDGPIKTRYEEIALGLRVVAGERPDRARHPLERLLHRQPCQAPHEDDREPGPARSDLSLSG